MTEIQRDDASQTARRYDVPELGSVFGIVAPVSRPFCCLCSRIRVTADGHLRPCLFSETERDLRPILRSGAADDEIARAIREAVRVKSEGDWKTRRHTSFRARSMAAIGG